jgi:hypothetical protein
MRNTKSTNGNTKGHEVIQMLIDLPHVWWALTRSG